MRIRLLALLAVVSMAVILPLYGDPRSSPVAHSEWARMLLHATELDAHMEGGATASQVFSVLSWKESLALQAQSYLEGSGVEYVGPDRARRHVLAVDEIGEVFYPITVVRGGDYRLRLKVKGSPLAPITAQIARVGEKEPVREAQVIPGAVESWIETSASHLDPGAYVASCQLPQGTELFAIEVVPPCLTPVEPLGGWHPTDIVDDQDLAVTLIKSLDREWDLPPADAPIELRGSDLQATESQAVSLASTGPETGEEDGSWFHSSGSGSQAVLFVTIPEDGLYTLWVFGRRGAGQSWSADACRKAVLCAAPERETEAADWRAVLTAPFSRGRHFFTVNLGQGAAVGRLRLERKREDGADYVAALKRAGLDPGPAGPVARAKAVEAMDWLRRRYPQDVTRPCGDIEVKPPQGASAGVEQALAQPQAPPPQTGGEGPVGPGNPTVVPPPDVTNPPGPRPSPSPSAVPSPLPCEPPGSPDVPNPCPSPSPL